jgi:dihydroorotate dehydrogenase
MNALWPMLRSAAFLLDPERAHDMAMWLIQSGALSGRSVTDSRLMVRRFGVAFPNPIGLAAGFDKSGVAIDHWADFGFGFAEVGTATYHAQPGNPKPRLFRLPEDRALINRFGFNNEGAAVLAERLSKARSSIPIGINLGKSKIAELEHAAEDYHQSFKLLHPYGDYFVINVSSPNTPGLRALQDKGALGDIIDAMRSVDASRPLFVKVAPDLTLGALDDVLALAVDKQLAGIIATNTTLSRDGLKSKIDEMGGLSGQPLTSLANGVLQHLASQAPDELTLIGVGGIMNSDDLWDRIASGAHLCQVYTGWVYGGPNFVAELLEGLLARMEREGVKSVDQLRGSATY